MLARVGSLMSRTAGVVVPPPTTNLDFTAIGTDPAALPAGSTFTRASGATRINSRGYQEELASNLLRPIYDPALEYSLISNPWGDGAAAPSLPTGWSVGAGAGITPVYLGNGVRNGIPYTRWRMQGTSGGGSFPSMRFHGTGAAAVDAIPNTIGNPATAAVYFEVVRLGTGHTLQDFRLANLGIAADGSTTTENFTTAINNDRTFNDGPFVYARTLTNAATAYSRVGMSFGNAAGRVFDVDFDIGFPTFTTAALTAITDRVPLATLAARTGTTPLYGYLGHLLEEASTNSIVNPRFEGAVAGSPGTQPTGWTQTSSANGITRTIVGVGIEDGIPYEEVRYAGTATSSFNLDLYHDFVAALINEVWTMSGFARLVAGTMPAALQFRISEYAGTTQVQTSVNSYTPDGRPLRQQRYSHSRTFTDATTTQTRGIFRIFVTSAQVIDFTIRYGAPQMEKQPFPTSVILPAVGAPLATTRARDDLALPSGALNAATCSIATRFALARGGSAGALAGSAWVLTADDNTTAETVRLLTTAGSNTLGLTLTSGGVAQASFPAPAGATEAARGVCLAWGAGSALAAWDGAAATLDPAATSPASLTQFRVNALRTVVPSGANCVMRSIRVWAGTKLTAGQVQRESGKTS